MQQSIKDRLRETRRRKLINTIRFLVISVLIITGIVKGWQYIHSDEFEFGHAEIRGTSLITEDDVIRMGGSKRPFNFFNISISRLKDGLKQDVRFKDSEVSYRWPGVIQVVAQEREPAIYLANSYRSYLKLDYDGIVMSVTTGIPDAKAPVLVGAQSGNLFLGDQVSDQNVLQILKFLQAIDGEARDRIAEVAIDNRQEVKIRQRNSFPILLGPAATLPDKVKVFMTVFNEIKDKNIQAEYIDITFAKPYIKLIPEKDK